jgi:leucyl/phenylalanyl-tRNA--protein transferase
MPFFLPEDQSHFPDIELADTDGLLAIGGNLLPQTLLKAYKLGIFPWYNEGEPICWYSPDPRFVLFPEKLKISASMKKVLKSNEFTFSIDKDFSQIIKSCRLVKRKGELGTWISDEIEYAYTSLFEKGFAQCAETWYHSELAGGLYGLMIGKVFFGESMFTNKTNASKFAFINYVQALQKNGIKLIDCQVYTPHLESLGSEFIPRKEFSKLIQQLTSE